MRVAESAPIERILNHAGMIRRFRRRLLPPPALSGDGAGIGVEQEARPVKQQPTGGVIWPIHPVGVFKLRDLQTKHDHRPGVSDAAAIRKGQNRIRLLFSTPEQTQLAADRANRMDGEADAARHGRCAVKQEQAGPHGEAAHGSGRAQGLDRRRLHGQYGFLGHGFPPCADGRMLMGSVYPDGTLLSTAQGKQKAAGKIPAALFQSGAHRHCRYCPYSVLSKSDARRMSAWWEM